METKITFDKNLNKEPFNKYFLSDFVSIQRKSFFTLLEKGLIEEFSKRNPITNLKKTMELFFYPDYYQLTPPEYSPNQAIVKSKSYTSKLYIPVQLTDKTTNIIKLKWVYIGNIPLMTKRGHFILNGCARVIVNQMIRSPGIYYQKKIYENFIDKWSEKPETIYERYYADLICNRGTWLRLEIDKHNRIWAQMKRVPKIPIMWFLISMGLSEKIILKRIIDSEKLLYNLIQDPLNPEKKGLPYIKNPPTAWVAIYNLVTKRSKNSNKSNKKNINSLINDFIEMEASQISKHFQSAEKNIKLTNFKKTIQSKNAHLIPKVVSSQAELDDINPVKVSKQKAEKSFNKLLFSLEKKKLYLTSNPTPLNQPVSLNTNLASLGSFPFRERLGKPGLISGIVPSNEGEKGGRGKKGVNQAKQGKTQSKKQDTTSAIQNYINKNLSNNVQADLGRKWIFNKFMNPRTYDLGQIGRLNFNEKLNLQIALNQTTLTPQDVLLATDYLILVSKGLRPLDDIDHLKNRRVRTSGELIQLQIGIGLVRLEKTIREKMNKLHAQILYRKQSAVSSQALLGNPKGNSKIISLKGNKTSPGISNVKKTKFNSFNSQKDSLEIVSISNIINTKPFNGALKEFFGSSPLSQFMDQINPLAELTHKRRLSSMGPGGVTRDSATLEIRGIHPSHYGRICPVETPEGKNTGLVNSLTAYARVNSDGYIETPFYQVYKGQVQKKTGLFFFSAKQEEKIKLGASDLYTTDIGFLPLASIPVRIINDFTKIARNEIQYVGVAPIQMISIATSLIPFFEHDDGNRALMGSNMQRQAVPILKPQRPIVGTGLETRAVSDSGHVLQAKYSGIVTYVSSKKIQIYSLRTSSLLT